MLSTISSFVTLENGIEVVWCPFLKLYAEETQAPKFGRMMVIYSYFVNKLVDVM